MTPPLLPRRAHLFARLDETSVGLFAAVSAYAGDGVVVLRYVEVEQVGGGEVEVAGCAAVCVGLLVVGLVGAVGGKTEGGVGWEVAVDYGGGCGGRGGEVRVLARVCVGRGFGG